MIEQRRNERERMSIARRSARDQPCAGRVGVISTYAVTRSASIATGVSRRRVSSQSVLKEENDA
jgi:hypothetical protein